MDVYIFQADIYCESCGKGLMMEIPKPAHAARDDESTYDSDEWPKGPYGDGGGEADCPQHCGMCGLFLDNSLTEDGSTYVKQAWEAYMNDERGRLSVLLEWRDGYPVEFAEWCADAEAREEANQLSNGQLSRLSDLADS